MLSNQLLCNYVSGSACKGSASQCQRRQGRLLRGGCGVVKAARGTGKRGRWGGTCVYERLALGVSIYPGRTAAIYVEARTRPSFSAPFLRGTRHNRQAVQTSSVDKQCRQAVQTRGTLPAAWRSQPLRLASPFHSLPARHSWRNVIFAALLRPFPMRKIERYGQQPGTQSESTAERPGDIYSGGRCPHVHGVLCAHYK